MSGDASGSEKKDSDARAAMKSPGFSTGFFKSPIALFRRGTVFTPRGRSDKTGQVVSSRRSFWGLSGKSKQPAPDKKPSETADGVEAPFGSALGVRSPLAGRSPLPWKYPLGEKSPTGSSSQVNDAAAAPEDVQPIEGDDYVDFMDGKRRPKYDDFDKYVQEQHKCNPLDETYYPISKTKVKRGSSSRSDAGKIRSVESTFEFL